MINLASQLLLPKEKNALNNFIKAIFKEMNYCQKIIKKHFNRNLFISAKDEQRFQSSNKCWVCNKLVDVGDNKVSDHCHITH